MSVDACYFVVIVMVVVVCMCVIVCVSFLLIYSYEIIYSLFFFSWVSLTCLGCSFPFSTFCRAGLIMTDTFSSSAWEAKIVEYLRI